MIKPISFVTFLVLSPTLLTTLKFPPFLPKCSINQADFDDCVTKAVKNGVQQLEKVANYLHLSPINPFTVTEAKFGAQGVLAVDQQYKNIEVYGLVNVIVDTFKIDFHEKTINMSGIFPRLTILSDYKFSGRILLLPVEGSGKCNVTIDNLKTTSLGKFEKVEKNNKSYIRLVSNTLEMFPEQLYFNFENIFRDNEEISKNINQVMNENWRQVYEDVKDGYIEVIRTIILNLQNQFFSKVSYEEAFN